MNSYIGAGSEVTDGTRIGVVVYVYKEDYYVDWEDGEHAIQYKNEISPTGKIFNDRIKKREEIDTLWQY